MIRPIGSTSLQQRGRLTPSRARVGFSLLEVVIVIVILAFVAAIAIPRLSRGSQGSIEAALARDVQVMQKAIDLYAADHSNAFPDPAMIADQLTLYTDHAGASSKGKTARYSFGPYLRRIPPVPSGPNRGSSNISTAPGIGVGWIYDPAEGTIAPNNTPPPTSATAPSNPLSER